jgi:ribosomal protein S6--L-glutamate ligase
MNITSSRPSIHYKGEELATGKDVAAMIIQFIERHATAGRTQTRGRG